MNFKFDTKKKILAGVAAAVVLGGAVYGINALETKGPERMELAHMDKNEEGRKPQGETGTEERTGNKGLDTETKAKIAKILGLTEEEFDELDKGQLKEKIDGLDETKKAELEALLPQRSGKMDTASKAEIAKILGLTEEEFDALDKEQLKEKIDGLDEDKKAELEALMPQRGKKGRMDMRTDGKETTGDTDGSASQKKKAPESDTDSGATKNKETV